MTAEAYITKGSRIRAQWLAAYPCSLAGVQPKVGAMAVEVDPAHVVEVL